MSANLLSMAGIWMTLNRNVMRLKHTSIGKTDEWHGLTNGNRAGLMERAEIGRALMAHSTDNPRSST
jgi:hypothetical protein